MSKAISNVKQVYEYRVTCTGDCTQTVSNTVELGMFISTAVMIMQCEITIQIENHMYCMLQGTVPVLEPPFHGQQTSLSDTDLKTESDL